ncbi:MAG: hypothetical protein M3Q05_09735 [Bacteroidota bacterium]|nr:hypothetical protein [Bacteroidota bacterium]
MNPTLVQTSIILFQASYITIEYVPECEWLYVNWRGEVNKEMAIDGNEKILLAIKKYQVKKLLNNNSYITGNWNKIVKRLMKIWFPRFFGSGLMFVAWVQSPCIASQKSLQKALKHQLDNVTILVFEDIEIASAWLNEV